MYSRGFFFFSGLIKENRRPGGHTRDIYNVMMFISEVIKLTAICVIFVIFPRILHYTHTNKNLGDVFSELKTFLKSD